MGLAESEPSSPDAIAKPDARKRSLLQMSASAYLTDVRLSAGNQPGSALIQIRISHAVDEKEMNIIRTAVMEREGLIQSIFSLLRQVPRRLVMILKLNDLTRSLDQSLATTHGSVSRLSMDR